MRNRRTSSSTGLVRQNIRLAKQLYPSLQQPDFTGLRGLTQALRLSILKGELLLIERKWYVTHAGLLQVATRRRCFGISAVLQERLSDPTLAKWIFKATVYTCPGSKGFVGYGDADPSNVSSLVHGAEMRVAETRAVNRALRKAYGIGLCSVAWNRQVTGLLPRDDLCGLSGGGELGDRRFEWSPRIPGTDLSTTSITSTGSILERLKAWR